MALSAGTYRGRLGDRLYTTEMPRAGEVVSLNGLGQAPRTQYPYQTLTLGGLGIANPASENCVAKGGRLEVRGGTPPGGLLKDATAQYGVCIFPDGSECEEWKFFRGECAPAGFGTDALARAQAFFHRPGMRAVAYAQMLGGIAGTVLGAYHGVKRNKGKVWPGIGWALVGGWFWPIVIPVIFVQGVGKRKGS